MTYQPHALVVDDEPDICDLVAMTLEKMQVSAQTAGDIATARTMLRNHRFDLCITDMRLPDGDGIDLVKTVTNDFPNLPIAIITAHGSMETAISALKAGAFDFVSKPVDLNSLRNLVSTALKLREKPHSTGSRQSLRLLGDSAAIQAIRQTISKLARSQAPVYISGESGTGKELVARLIHELGPRHDKPFVPINCGAIPEDLMESELFGHRKGSFTGATSDKIGLFQAAEGGTLFLDEVADLPLHMQVKLLRAIQEKSIRPVGAPNEIATDVRILSATHKDLHRLVQDGVFRQDLFYRINVIEVRVPPLRERQGDILLLARHFLETIATRNGVAIPMLSRDAEAALLQYPFPGNIRELENILERAVTLCEDQVLRDTDLQLPATARSPDHPANPAAAPPPADSDPPMPLETYLDSIEKEAILRALEQTRYNKTAAAKLLGITFRALRYRLKKLGLE